MSSSNSFCFKGWNDREHFNPLIHYFITEIEIIFSSGLLWRSGGVRQMEQVHKVFPYEGFYA